MPRQSGQRRAPCSHRVPAQQQQHVACAWYGQHAQPICVHGHQQESTGHRFAEQWGCVCSPQPARAVNTPSWVINPYEIAFCSMPSGKLCRLGRYAHADITLLRPPGTAMFSMLHLQLQIWRCGPGSTCLWAAVPLAHHAWVGLTATCCLQWRLWQRVQGRLPWPASGCQGAGLWSVQLVRWGRCSPCLLVRSHHWP